MFWIWIILSFFGGSVFSYFLCALLSIASRGDDEAMWTQAWLERQAAIGKLFPTKECKDPTKECKGCEYEGDQDGCLISQGKLKALKESCFTSKALEKSCEECIHDDDDTCGDAICVDYSRFKSKSKTEPPIKKCSLWLPSS